MSRSGSIHDQPGSSASAQVSRSDRQTEFHASPLSIPLTSSAGQPRDDGDGTPSSHLIVVTSFAPGSTSTVSTFSKDNNISPIAVLKSENQSSDKSSTYQVRLTNERRVTEVSPTLKSSLGEENIKSIDPSGDSFRHSNVITSSVISTDVDKRVKTEKSVSWITDSKRADYSTSCATGSGCSFSIVSTFPDLSAISPTFETLSISSTPVLKEPTTTKVQNSISSTSLKPLGDFTSTLHPSNEKIAPSWNSGVYDIPVTSTRFAEPSTHPLPSTTWPSVHEALHDHTNSLDQKETFHFTASDSSTFTHDSFQVSRDPIDFHPSSSVFLSLSNLPSSISPRPTSLNHSPVSNPQNQNGCSAVHCSGRVDSEPWSLTGPYSDEDKTTSSTQLKLFSDSLTATMTQLPPSRTPSFETLDVSGGSVSPTSTPSLPKPSLKSTTALVQPSAVPSSISISVETVTKSSDIHLMTSKPFLDPSIKISDSVSSRNPPVSTKSIHSSSSSVVSTSPSSTPPLTAQEEHPKFTNIAFDSGYPTSSSPLHVTSSIKTRPDFDVPASNDQSKSIVSRKNSLDSPPSKSVVSPPSTGARISTTPPFLTSVLPSASVIGDDQGNSTVIPPGKVDANQDEGFLSGSGAIIVGSACGVFVVGVVIIIAVACALRRKRIEKTPKRDPRMDDLWVDIGRGDDRLPAPSVGPCLDVYDSQLAVKSNDQQLYRATQSYTSTQDGYLSFMVGDLIRIVEVSDQDWWRGIAVKDGTSGWFPTCCVEEDKGSTVEEPYATIDEDKMDTHGHISSFQIRRVDPEDTRPLVQENVAVHGTLESKDITDDVASWVKMAASVSMTSLRSIDTIGTCSTLNDYSTSVKGVHFRAIYAYKPVCKGEMGLKEGELVICKERDRNGWMLGVKPKTQDEGWFPAVYVDAVSSDDATLREEDVPAIYDLLDSNKLHNANQPWTGIEHKAVRSYTSDILGDLSFQSGDVIIVFQTLANGWWFGSKDKQSGWFPGAYLEIIEDDSEKVNTSFSTNMTSPHQLSTGNGYAKDILLPELSPLRSDLLLELKQENGRHGDPNSFFSFSATNSPRDSIASSVISDNDLRPLVSPKHATMDGRFKKAIRPNRKAPAPPTSLLAAKAKDSLHVDGTNSLRRPVRRAPAPPTRKPSKGESDTQSIPPESMNGSRDTPTFKKPMYLINGKRPKLVKVSPDTFDDKSLNPVIRPATRGLAPVLSTPSPTSTVSSVQKHGYDAHKKMKNVHEVEHRVKPRPLTPLRLRIAENRHSSASRASYGSTTDTITSDHISSECRPSPFQDHTKEPFVMTCNLSRSSTPTILQGSGHHRGSKTVTTVSPPVIPTTAYDSNCYDFQYNTPSPPPPPPPEEHVQSLNHHITEAPKVNLSNFNNCVPIQNNDIKQYSNSTDTLTEINVNHNQHQPSRRMSSNQKVPPSTLPKPRLYSHNSSFSSFGKGSEHHNGVSEENLATTNPLTPLDVQRRPSEASRSLDPSPPRDSLALLPGKVSEIVHHINSLSPDSAFPPLHDGTELSLIIPQRKGSNAGPHTPKSIDTISPVNLHNGHNVYPDQDQSSTNLWNATKEVPKDLSQINQDILHKNTFVPIKDDLHEIEDRVSTFRSLPRPSRKRSKDAMSLSNEDVIFSSPKTDQYFQFFKPTLDEKVTEL